jgi:uncharacterized protein DUF2752
MFESEANFCLTEFCGKRRLAAIASVSPLTGLRPIESVGNRLWHTLAHWHDHVFGAGVDPSRDFYSFLFNRKAGLGALALVLLAAALPSQGAGVPICLFRYMTGLPCPGCGLTRSFSCILHGDFSHSYDFHPFGCVLLPLFIMIAATVFMPKSFRIQLEELVRARQSHLRHIYLTLIYGFIAFGVVRMAVYAAQGLHAL